ncbi:MAG: nucleotidyltransferase family protein [Lachnospiraceae bacterium]|nr:nucleotidyltransferase family protein [Lachnospiraceae bacterium]
MNTDMKLACVVMAAGKSLRFGGNKLAAELCGQPVLQRTLRALPFGRFDSVKLVVSDDAVERIAETVKKGDISLITDKIQADKEKMFGKEAVSYDIIKYPGGPVSETVKQGLKDIKGMDAYMFINADMPLIKKTSIDRLIDCFINNQQCIVRMGYGEVPGNPVIFPQNAYDELMSLEGEKGGGAIIKSGKYKVLMVQADEEYEMLDVDTRERFEEAEHILTQKGNICTQQMNIE